MIRLKATITNILQFFFPKDVTSAGVGSFVVLGAGIIYLMILLTQQDLVGVLLFVPGLALLVGLVNYPPMQRLCLGVPFNWRHLLHIMLYWFYSALSLWIFRFFSVYPTSGKDSQLFYVGVLACLAVAWAGLRSLLIVTIPRAYGFFSTRIPLWEQALLAANEGLAAVLVSYVWGAIGVQLAQPNVFSVRLNPIYALGLGSMVLVFYVVMQLMWQQRWNERLSLNSVWLPLARLMSPFVLFVITMLISARFTTNTDPRTASLLESADLNLAVLALAPVIWLLVFTVMIIVYVDERGIRQRFLPDALLAILPTRIKNLLMALSDIDFLLLLGVVVTITPVSLLFFGEDGGIIGTARRAILQRGSALIETSEQALAILFVLPFYVFAIALLILYALVVSRPAISAEQREGFMRQLPVGFLISMVITLYLFALPFTQVFIEGRLPTLPRDLGRILAFYVFVPLLLLYFHYLLLIRLPYGRGQRLWRVQESVRLSVELENIDRRIRTHNQELERINNRWQLGNTDDPAAVRNRLDILHRYIHLNSERDDLNMQRLKIVAARQQLIELSDAPLSVTVARLPLRIISIGLPLLLLFQVYQWAILNQGLREIVNNPSITLTDFIRILLENINF